MFELPEEMNQEIEDQERRIRKYFAKVSRAEQSGKLSGVVRIYEMQTLQSVQFSTVSLANGEGLMEYKTPKFGF